MFCMLTAPGVMSWVMWYKHDKLKKPSLTKKIGVLYTGRKVDRRGHEEQWTPVMLFYRRTIFAYCTVHLFDKPNLQIIVNYALTMASILYLAHD